MRKIRNVLSLFDGVACGKLALERAGIEFENYYASEIDPVCIAIAEKNHSDIISLGDVANWKEWNLEDIDLIIGGSPCQGFSSQGNQLNFNDPRSKLFFTMVDIIEHYHPSYYLLENVGMRNEWKEIITDYLGVAPVVLNSALVSAQERKRLYWANWDIPIPEDREIHLTSILAHQKLTRPASIKGRRINPNTGKREDHNKEIPYSQCLQVKKDMSKIGCLTTVSKDAVLTHLPHGRYPHAYDNYTKDVDWRYLTPIEYERAQTVPDDYTIGYSDSVRQSVMGNGWTVDMIVHILQSAP
jgi:DNA (cytosine-5)-methyltransferase 1